MELLTLNAADDHDPRFAGVMLRVVLALKQQPDAGLEAVVERAVNETGVDGATFRAFFSQHMDILATAHKRSQDR